MKKDIHLIPTKEDVLTMVKRNMAQEFYNLFYNNSDIEFTKDGQDVILVRADLANVVYDMNYGDGNEWIITYCFPSFDNLYVSIKGCYSSYDSSNFHEIYLSKPHEYTAIRYEKI